MPGRAVSDLRARDLRCTAARVLHDQRGKRGQEPRQADDQEDRPPPQSIGDGATQDESQRRADRQRQIIDAHRPAPLADRKQVGQEGRRDHAITGFTNSQQRPPEKHVIEIGGKCRPDRRQAPQTDAAEDESLRL